MNFYEVPEDRSSEDIKLQQGDILSPVPFVGFSLTEAIIIPPNSEEHKIVDFSASEELENNSRILANIESHIGIVLNQTCDLIQHEGKGKPILVARVVAPCEERIPAFNTENVKKVVGVIKNLKNPGHYPNIFYLPEHNDEPLRLPKAIVDLLEVACFSPKVLEALSRLVKLQLSPEALTALQERLSYCFGRFAVPDHLYFSEGEWTHICQELKK